MHGSAPLILAQSNVGPVLVRSLVMIGLIIVAFLLVVRLRRWLTDDDPGPAAAGFSLSDLKQLHREGKISTEEFERARAKMVGAAREMTSKLPDPLEGSTRRRQQPPQQQQPPNSPL
jgi:hypothetical protein